MKFFLLLALFFCGCQTTVYQRNGKPGLKIPANATNVVYKDGTGVEFSSDKLDHSTPTRAAGSVLGTGLSGAAGIITSTATRGIIR